MSESTGSGYEDEPREHFEPLPPHLHSLFYHHERLDGDLDAEYHYYRNAFAPNCRHILELGCGTSLLSSRLAAQGMRVTGIDLDPGMLRLPSGQRTGATAQMDMCDLGFRPCFHGVLIAHNTLNLLVEKGLLGMQTLRGGAVVFDPNVERHHHFVDSDTGEIFDIPWDHVRVQGQENLKDYEILEYQVIMRGRRKKGR